MESLDTRKSFSPAEIAARNGLGLTSVYADITAGRLIAKKRGSRLLITTESEQNWLDRLPTASKAA